MNLITILIGITLIILGRKALWLGVFSGVFLAASQILTYILFDQPETTIWLVSGVIASICLILYLTVEKVMVIITGAIGGGFLAFTISDGINIATADTVVTKLAVFLAGALIGILLLQLVYEWAMTAFTSLIGAYFISSLLIDQPLVELLLLVILSLIGIAIQAKGKITTKQSDFQEAYPEPYR